MNGTSEPARDRRRQLGAERRVDPAAHQPEGALEPGSVEAVRGEDAAREPGLRLDPAMLALHSSSTWTALPKARSRSGARPPFASEESPSTLSM